MPLSATTITSAELRGLTERLGLPVAWLSNEWGIREGEIKRWMHSGTHKIPDWVSDDVAQIVADTERQVVDLIERARAGVKRDGHHTLLTFRNDAELRDLPDDDPRARYTAAWHRNLCTRVVEQVPGVRMRYYFKPGELRGKDHS